MSAEQETVTVSAETVDRILGVLAPALAKANVLPKAGSIMARDVEVAVALALAAELYAESVGANFRAIGDAAAALRGGWRADAAGYLAELRRYGREQDKRRAKAMLAGSVKATVFERDPKNGLVTKSLARAATVDEIDRSFGG